MQRQIMYLILLFLVSSLVYAQDDRQNNPENGLILFGALGQVYRLEPDGSNVEHIIDLTIDSAINRGRDAANISVAGSSILYSTTNAITEDFDIYLYSLDNSQATQLTNNDFADVAPRFGGDGTQIVFSSTRDGEDFEVYAMDSSGENLVQLTNNDTFDVYGEISPDGSMITYLSSRVREDEDYYYSEMNLMERDGTNSRTLAELRIAKIQRADYFPLFAFLWSPDGSKIAYLSYSEAGYINLFVYDIVTEETVQLTDDEDEYTVGAAWSPNSQSLAVTFVEALGTPQGEAESVTIINLVTGEESKLELPESILLPMTLPAWSPDGLTIAFGVFNGTERANYLATIQLDGTNFQVLIETPGGDRDEAVDVYAWLPR